MATEIVGFEHLSEACAEVGVALDKMSAGLRARLQLLATATETVSDARRIIDCARALFRCYDAEKPERRFSDSEKRVVVIGSLFADIGKTGPPSANAAQRRLIAEMFGVEGVLDDKQSVAEFLRAAFPRDGAQRVQRFAALGLDPGMTLRAFWNLHAYWTLQILRSDRVPKEAVAAAATHHLLENVNPEAIVGQDGRYAVDFGAHTEFDRADKLVILLDKYDAVRRRGKADHGCAISWLRALLAKHPRFHDDREFLTLLDDLDMLGKREA